jgi:predicted transcriptional regulator
MEVHLPPTQEAQLAELAVKTGRGADELVQEAVARLLSYNEWFKQQVQIGVDQIARGEFIEEEEMDPRIKRMLQSWAHSSAALLTASECYGLVVKSATRKASVRLSRRRRRRENFLHAANADFAALKRNPKAWMEELRERKLWEHALADGLAKK